MWLLEIVRQCAQLWRLWNNFLNVSHCWELISWQIDRIVHRLTCFPCTALWALFLAGKIDRISEKISFPFVRVHRFDRIFMNETETIHRENMKAKPTNLQLAVGHLLHSQTKSNHHPYPAIVSTDKSALLFSTLCEEIVNFYNVSHFYDGRCLVNIHLFLSAFWNWRRRTSRSQNNTQHEHAKSSPGSSSHIFGVCATSALRCDDL